MTLGTSCGRWSRKLKCEVFFASWEPAARLFLCRHLAPGVDEMLRWVDAGPLHMHRRSVRDHRHERLPASVTRGRAQTDAG
jgi:hypothetical protein